MYLSNLFFISVKKGMKNYKTDICHINTETFSAGNPYMKHLVDIPRNGYAGR